MDRRAHSICYEHSVKLQHKFAKLFGLRTVLVAQRYFPFFEGSQKSLLKRLIRETPNFILNSLIIQYDVVVSDQQLAKCATEAVPRASIDKLQMVSFSLVWLCCAKFTEESLNDCWITTATFKGFIEFERSIQSPVG